jgi:oligopeptide/dipeptide ABC transporter ATP-binding protein
VSADATTVDDAAAAPLRLTVNNLSVSFRLKDGSTLPAVRDVDFAVAAGEILAIVGESGSGKSALSLAIMGLHGDNARVTGSARLGAVELLQLSPRAFDRLRGSAVSMVFQDPMTALDPIRRIGSQIAEAIACHRTLARREREAAVVGLLDQVGIPEPRRRARQYPHQLSGGLRQRALIALGIASRPQFLFADEPTTALDVAIQAQILALLRHLSLTSPMGLILVSHDLPLVSEVADRIVVMYAGQIVESGPAAAVIAAPRHPYTRGLLSSLPRDGTPPKSRLSAIEGTVPDLRALPSGCSFRHRCVRARAECEVAPPLDGAADGRQWRCFFPLAPGDDAAP